MNAADERIRRALGPLPMPWQPGPDRRAAVLAGIYRDAGEDWLALIVRRADLRQHPGQIAFPGGMDAGDADPAACALREAQEEIGIDPSQVVLLGSLGVRRSSSGHQVHALLGRIPKPDPARIDRSEVERLLPLPFAAALRLQAWEHRVRTGADGRVYPASPHLRMGGDEIWGLTGRFLFQMAEALQSG